MFLGVWALSATLAVSRPRKALSDRAGGGRRELMVHRNRGVVRWSVCRSRTVATGPCRRIIRESNGDVQPAEVAQLGRLLVTQIDHLGIDARTGHYSVSGGTRGSSWEIRAGMSRRTVSHTRSKFTSKYACTRRFRIPMILGQGMSGCAPCVSALTRDAASPTISTAFRIASCAIRSLELRKAASGTELQCFARRQQHVEQAGVVRSHRSSRQNRELPFGGCSSGFVQSPRARSNLHRGRVFGSTHFPCAQCRGACAALADQSARARQCRCPDRNLPAAPNRRALVL